MSRFAQLHALGIPLDGVRDLRRHAPVMLDRLIAGGSIDQVLAAMAGTTIRDGMTERPVSRADVVDVDRFLREARTRLARLNRDLAELTERRDRIAALLDAPAEVTR